MVHGDQCGLPWVRHRSPGRPEAGCPSGCWTSLYFSVSYGRGLPEAPREPQRLHSRLQPCRESGPDLGQRVQRVKHVKRVRSYTSGE